MKKLIAILALTFCLGISSITYAMVPRGVITSENAGNFIVLRDGEQIPCQKGEFLYDGDIIRGDNLDSLTVEWHPYAKPKLVSANELRVGYEEPGTIDVAVQKMKEFLGLVDTEVTVQYGASRGSETKKATDNVYPLPGFNATALQGEMVAFAWGDSHGKKLIIKDSKNKIVKSIEVSGQTTAEFLIAELGLTAGENYTWQIEGLYDKYKLRLLDNSYAEKITKNLKDIDESVANANDRFLQKAVYLQLVSDASPAQIELYWLSYQMLVKITPGEDALLKAKVERLKNNVIDHISGMR